MESTPIKTVDDMEDNQPITVEMMKLLLEKFQAPQDLKLDAIQVTLHGTEEEGTPLGLVKRVIDTEEAIKRIPQGAEYQELKDENYALKQQITVIAAVLERHEKELNKVKKDVTLVQERTMQDNILIGSLGERPGEICKTQAIKFFKSKLGVTLTSEEVHEAYRIGPTVRRVNKSTMKEIPRQMLVKLSTKARMEVMLKENISKLRGKKNKDGSFYYMVPQQPEATRERFNKAKAVMRSTKSIYKGTYPRPKIIQRGEKVFVNDYMLKETITPPTPAAYLDLESEEQEILNSISFTESEIMAEKGSTFQAFATSTPKLKDVRLAYCKVRQQHPAADHVSLAYHTYSVADLSAVVGAVDDGEYGAATRMLDRLEIARADFMSVFMVREYGGCTWGSADSHTWGMSANKPYKDSWTKRDHTLLHRNPCHQSQTHLPNRREKLQIQNKRNQTGNKI